MDGCGHRGLPPATASSTFEALHMPRTPRELPSSRSLTQASSQLRLRELLDLEPIALDACLSSAAAGATSPPAHRGKQGIWDSFCTRYGSLKTGSNQFHQPNQFQSMPTIPTSSRRTPTKKRRETRSAWLGWAERILCTSSEFEEHQPSSLSEHPSSWRPWERFC